MMLTLKRNSSVLRDEVNQAKEETSKLQKRLVEREASFKASEKKFLEAIDAAEAVMASLKAKVSEMNEELLDSTSVSLMEGRAILALEVYSGRTSQEDCKRIVDEYVENIGSMEDLLPKEAGAIVSVIPPNEAGAEEEIRGETTSSQ